MKSCLLGSAAVCLLTTLSVSAQDSIVSKINALTAIINRPVDGSPYRSILTDEQSRELDQLEDGCPPETETQKRYGMPSCRSQARIARENQRLAIEHNDEVDRANNR